MVIPSPPVWFSKWQRKWVCRWEDSDCTVPHTAASATWGSPAQWQNTLSAQNKSYVYQATSEKSTVKSVKWRSDRWLRTAWESYVKKYPKSHLMQQNLVRTTISFKYGTMWSSSFKKKSQGALTFCTMYTLVALWLAMASRLLSSSTK